MLSLCLLVWLAVVGLQAGLPRDGDTEPGDSDSVAHSNPVRISDELPASANCVQETGQDNTEVGKLPRVHVVDVSPLPRLTQRSRSNYARSRGKTVVLTSSPYKRELLSKRQLTVKKLSEGKGKRTEGEPVKKKICGQLMQSALAGKLESDSEKSKNSSKVAVGKKKKKVAVRNKKTGVACGGCGVREFSEEDQIMASGWVACQKCGSWFHDPCAESNGILDDDDIFTCRNCYD